MSTPTGVSAPRNALAAMSPRMISIRLDENVSLKCNVIGGQRGCPSSATPNAARRFGDALSHRRAHGGQAIVAAALQTGNGNYADAARGLGIHPNNLDRLARTLGVKLLDQGKRA